MWLLRWLHLQRIRVQARSLRLTNSSCYLEWLSLLRSKWIAVSFDVKHTEELHHLKMRWTSMSPSLGFDLAVQITLVTMYYQSRRIQIPCPSALAFQANLPPLSPCCTLIQCGIWIIHTMHVFIRPLKTGPHRTATLAFPALSSSRLSRDMHLSRNSIESLTITIRAKGELPGSAPLVIWNYKTVPSYPPTRGGSMQWCIFVGLDPKDPLCKTKCLQRALEDCQLGLPLKTHENFSRAVRLKDFYMCVSR